MSNKCTTCPNIDILTVREYIIETYTNSYVPSLFYIMRNAIDRQNKYIHDHFLKIFINNYMYGKTFFSLAFIECKIVKSLILEWYDHWPWIPQYGHSKQIKKIRYTLIHITCTRCTVSTRGQWVQPIPYIPEILISKNIWWWILICDEP